MTTKKKRKPTKFDLVMNDFKAFCKNFVQIVDNNGQLIPFNLNEEQDEFIDNMDKFNIILKSRQIGFTTMSLAYCLWQAVRNPNTNYMIVSLSSESVTGLFEKLKAMNDLLPRDRYKFPATDRDNRGELKLSNNSRVQIAASDGKQIGRGNTYQFILLSEFAFYQGDQSKVLTSLEQALAKNSTSKLVIESTAHGANNYFYDLYMRSHKGQTNYKTFFYGWTSNAYVEQFRFEHDIAEQWYRDTNKGQRLGAKDLTEEEQKIHESGANLRMLMWRRWKLSSMALQDFQQEFPSFIEEAFITSGNNIFDQGKLLTRLENVLPPIERDILKSELPSVLHSYLGRGLEVYHLPRRNVKYYGGVDTASGSGGDMSTISIMDEDGEEVCSFANNKITIYNFADVIDSIGRYFNYAFLCIERNSFGLPLLEKMRNEKQYMNLYKHRGFDRKGNRRLSLGFLTTATTKATLIADFKEAFEVGTININCRDTLNQMIIFIDDNGRTGNKRGANNYDDLVISHALAVQGAKARKWYV